MLLIVQSYHHKCYTLGSTKSVHLIQCLKTWNLEFQLARGTSSSQILLALGKSQVVFSIIQLWEDLPDSRNVKLPVLAQKVNLLVPDDWTALFLSPVYRSRVQEKYYGWEHSGSPFDQFIQLCPWADFAARISIKMFHVPSSTEKIKI